MIIAAETVQRTENTERTRLAFLLVALTAIWLSPQALLYDTIDSDVSPWVFSSLVMVAHAAGLTVFVLIPNKNKFAAGGEFAHLLKNRGWLTQGGRFWDKPFAWMIIALVGQTSFGFYYWSASYSDIAITETLLALFPIFAAIIGVSTPKALASSITTITLRERTVSRTGWALMVTATTGAGCVILSQSRSLSALSASDILGSLFGTLAAFVAALGMYSQLVLGESMLTRSDKARNATQMLTLAAFMTVCVRACGAVAIIVLAATLGEPILGRWNTTELAGGLAIGFIIYAPAWVSLRYANLVTSDMSPNALYHLTTILGISLLILLTEIDIASMPMFLAGAVLVIASGGLIATAGNRKR